MDNNDRILLEGFLKDLVKKIFSKHSDNEKKSKKDKDSKESKEKKSSKKKKDSKDDKKSKENQHSNKNSDKLLKQMLQDPKVNQAEIMRQLWHPEDEDAARSKFSKKVRGALNDDGVPYDFTDDEKTELFKILRGNK